MSSNTRVHATPVFNVAIRETEAVFLSQVLGQGGCEALREVLGEGAETVLPPEYGWQRVGTARNPQLYRLVLPGPALDAELQRHGVSEVTLDLKVGRHIAEVRHSTAYRSEQRETQAVREALRAVSHRAVNELLALAVTQRLAAQLTTFAGTRNQVHMSRVTERVQQQAHYRASVHLRARA